VTSSKQKRSTENASRNPPSAVESDDAAAEFAVGTYYARRQDMAAAARWYQKAAARGLPAAQFRLGYYYQNGRGVPRDPGQANFWYLKAAEQGNVGAMYNLALLAANGKPDYATAARWFKRAAEYGLRNSQYNFAVLLAQGLGIPRDLISSYAWFAIAAEQGDQGAAEKRDEIGTRLNSDQLAAAKVFVASFHARTPDVSANETRALIADQPAGSAPAAEE
jgi:localization factor PodJL